MSEPAAEPDELSEEEVVAPFLRVMRYVTEWANTDARREDVMSTLWTVVNRRPRPSAAGHQR